jgi:hypothetical protein
MDFSSISRSLESLRRRQPPLPDRIIEIAHELDAQLKEPADSTAAILATIQELVNSDCDRWEPLAVGLYNATALLESSSAAAVYMEGPRVPITTAAATASTHSVLMTSSQVLDLCRCLHAACLLNIEHAEPRVRTLVAKCIGAYCRTATDPSIRRQVQAHVVECIHGQILQGRDEHGEYSRTSTGALDDTTGWRALETNWQCLAALVAALQGKYHDDEHSLTAELLEDCEYSSIKHVNRHVRAAAMAVLEQWVTAAVDSGKAHELLYQVGSPLRKCALNVLRVGLADNWSQVRMAASVLCRVLFQTLKDYPTEDLCPTLLPRMCLNRFYLAQGVKLYSFETWKLVFPTNGLQLVADNLSAVCRYYVKAADFDNHVVREASCQAIAELAVKFGNNPQYHDQLIPHLEVLMQALLMAFHDESWPVRDEACLACGILCKAYPEQCKPELNTLWERWTEQLTDQIWSVREDAAVALGDALEAYGLEFLDKLRGLIKTILPAAKEQPALTQEEYKAHTNDIKAHTDSTLYSCGSLAPKLRKGGAGRIGCSNCGIDRPKAPWEATDGCIYLLRELCIKCCGPENADKPIALEDDELFPLMQELSDVCRVQHFPQSSELRATLWKQLPAMAHAIGKQRFKDIYLEVFLDLMFSNMESRSASQLSVHAAGQCAEDIANLVGPRIFRARLEDHQQKTFDTVMRERQLMPKGPSDGAAFSPFGPPGMIEQINGPATAIC